jgi:4-amino-4-deoxy-L-arabinose transferase-like glycosyltransferase
MPPRVWILWILFLVRGTFYCAMLPLWEGWDEYAHFAWLQHWLDNGGLNKSALPGFHDPVSREIDESMRLAPLAYELRWLGPPYLTHEQWWALPKEQRAERQRQLRSLPPAWAHEPAAHVFDFYEAQQPPLYYVIVSAPLRRVAAWPLEDRVRLVRYLSMAIASLAIPLAWMAARYVVGDALATACAALLAVAPGFAIDVSRVANDCLAIALTGALFWLLARGRVSAWRVGTVLGAALLSKAYLLALLPALAILWWRRRRDLTVALAVAFAIAGWWYIRNVAIGNTLSGWSLRADAGQVLRAFLQIDWLSASHVIAKSFIWFGAWSFLTLKSWMYTVIEAGAAVALALAVKNRKPELALPALLAGAYLFAMSYGVATYWVTQHVPNLPGWYLWPVASMFGAILVAGLRRFSFLMVVLLAAVDLYGAMALLAPYYAGLVERNRADAGKFLAALARLHVPVWMAGAWIAATVGIVVIAAMTNYGGEKQSGYRH